jgi:hypothetical protein
MTPAFSLAEPDREASGGDLTPEQHGLLPFGTKEKPMSSFKYLRSAALAVAMAAAPALLPASAEAAACLTSDVTLTIGGTLYNPTSCADNLSQGGGPIAETGSLNTALGTSFVYLDKSDDAGTPTGLGGVTFAVTASAGNSGTWTVTWTDVAGLPRPCGRI